MEERRNYQRELEEQLLVIRERGERPTLLLHACCAPCSSYVLEYLEPYFRIVLFYYNPNITEAEEFARRASELHRLAEEMPSREEIRVIDGSYDPESFFRAVQGLEELPEGGDRCRICFALRLRKAAETAVRIGADFFTTTLSISPHKNAEDLNRIGEKVGSETGIPYLPSDFKKRNGYARSTELSEQYGLYRQDYCGCVFSKRERERKRQPIV